MWNIKQKNFLLKKLDTYFKVQCSNQKTDDYIYKPLKEALKYKFLRFGNSRFIPALSIDLDDILYFPSDKIKELGLPEPTFIVQTDRGFHIHWFLKNPIVTANYKQIFRLQITIKYLQQVLNGDKSALTLASARVWRNPLEHSSAFAKKEYNLSDICKVVPDKFLKVQEKIYNKKSYYDKLLSVDFSSLKEGERHMTLFDYGRAFAYTHLDEYDNMFSILSEKNDEIPYPLGEREVDSIANSIVHFMNRTYTGSSKISSYERRKFNQKVAKKQKDKKFNELSKRLLTFFAPLHVLSKSIRKGSALLKTSKDTWTKHKEALKKLIYSILSTKITFINSSINYSFLLLCPSNYNMTIIPTDSS